MCGLAGIFAYGRVAPAVHAAELTRIRDHMAARGPDGKATWIAPDGRAGLAHRRLSIIDLSERGAQPMHSADGKLCVTFNGEIYNYQALRTALEAKGHVFRSTSDTEVLLHLYAEKGEAMVGDLRGMFAFALWDAEKRGLLLVRDPFGIKPLYFADDGATIRFASQVKALLAGGGVPADPDTAGWAGFHLFGCVPDPFTTYRAIRALPRGSTMWIDASGPRPSRRYFHVAQIYREAESEPQKLAAEDVQAAVRAAVLDSVRHHLVADVPVGAFLSAGVDSGALVGLMRDAGQSNIETVTLSFDEYRGKAADEGPLAGEVAARYGTRHTTRHVGEREFQDDLPRILAAMDQPSIDGINSWFVSKAARELGLKVAISGLGGDEIFGGYSSFREIPKLLRWMSVPARVPLLGKAVRQAVSRMTRLTPRIKPKSAGVIEYGGDYPGAFLLRRSVFMPWELGAVMGEDAARDGLERLHLMDFVANALTPQPRSAFGRIASLECELYMGNQLLRDTDWASMAHSLEVRVPLVDSELVKRIAPLTTAYALNGKELLGRSPTQPLPESIISRRKTGFSMPFESWIAHSPSFQQRGNGQLTAAWARRWACHLAESAA